MRTKLNDISKKQKVLNYLLRYGSIDRSTALTHAKVWNLSTITFKLKKEGHDIRLHRPAMKYVLYDKLTNKPVFSRFIPSKQQEATTPLNAPQ